MDWLHIEQWLTSIYNNHVPVFERTEKNYYLLDNLQKLDLNSIQVIETVLKQEDQVAIDTLDLSRQGQDALDALANVSLVLGLEKTELSNFITAITKCSLDKMELDLQENSLDDIQYKLNEAQHVVNHELNQMKNILLKLQSSRDNQQQQKIPDHQLKKITSEYITLKSRYNNLNVERKGIRLTHLKELDVKANIIEQELKEKNDVLTHYQVLPSEMILASIKIQKTQDLLHELESEREHLLGDIAHSVS